MFSSEDHTSSAVQYVLKFVKELLVASSLKVVATVQPQGNKTVTQSNWCITTKCTSTTLDTTQRTVAASGKLIDVNHERQFGIEQPRLQTLADSWTVVAADKSGVSGGWALQLMGKAISNHIFCLDKSPVKWNAFSRWTWVSQCSLKQRIMENEMVVTTGAINRAKLHSNHHHQQTNIQFFLQAGCPSCRPTNNVKALKGS